MNRYKKIVAYLLIVSMTCSIFNYSAFTFSVSAEVKFDEMDSLEIVRLNGKIEHIDDYSEDYIVLLWGDLHCGNTLRAIETMEWYLNIDTSLRVILLNMDSSEDELKAFEKQHTKVTIANSDNYSGMFWSLVKKYDYEHIEDACKPLCIVLDSSRNIVMVSNGETANDDFIDFWTSEFSEKYNIIFKVQCNQTEARKITQKVNEFRTGNNAWEWDSDNKTKKYHNSLAEYKYDYGLEKIAIQRAKEIAVKYAHDRPNGKSCFSAYSETYKGGGENIAYGYETAAEVFEAWKEENEDYSNQGHRRNMLSESNHAIGVACIIYNGVEFWVQEFSSNVVNQNYVAPKDGTNSAKVELSDDVIENIDFEVDNKSVIQISRGETYSLEQEEIIGKLSISGCIFETFNVKITPAWYVEDTKIAKMSSSNSIIGLKNGKTYLKSEINKFGYNNTVSIDVNVYGDLNDESEIKIGQKVEFSVPNSIPVIGGGDISLDFDNIPIQFVQEGNAFKLGIGTKNLAKTGKDEWFNFKKFVETQNDDLKKGLNSLLASKFGIASMGRNIKPSISCYGYLEGTITSSGVQSAGGEMVIEIKTKATQEWQTVVVVVPVVIKASAEVGVKADLGIGLDFNNSKVYIKGTYTLTLPKVKASIGVGVAYIADVSVYGSATNEICITSKNFSDPDITATFKGEFGASAKVLFAEYEKKIWSGEKQYYSSKGSANKKVAIMKSKAMPVSDIGSDMEYVIEREEQSNWKNGNNSSTVENTVVLNNVYNSAQPQIVQTNSGKKVLIYTADIDARSTGNHTAIVYSVYNENTKKWSNPVIVDDDGTSDFYPSVAVNGENVYVAWSNSNKLFTEEEVADENFITKVASSLDIELAIINLSNNSISKKKVNTNEKMDINSTVAINNGKVYVGWIENESNDIFEMTGENSIYISDISNETTKLYINENTQITSMAIGNLEDEICIAYAVDEDSDLSTIDDINLYMGDILGDVTNIGSGTYSNIQFAKISGNDSMLCYSSNDDETASIIFTDEWWELNGSLNCDAVITTDYKYIEGTDSDLLICSSDKEGEEDGTDVFAYVIKNGNISEVVDIANNEGYTRNASGIYSNSKFILAYTRTDVTMDESSVDESTDLCVTQITPSRKLVMENVSYNPEAIQPDEEMNVTVVVKNNGLLEDSNYTVQILSGTNVIGESTVNESMGVGEEAEITVPVNIPEDFKLGTTLTFKVIASDGTFISEGSITEKVGKADLQLEVNETSKMVDVLAENTTAFDCGATLYIKDTDEEGKVYKTYEIENIEGKDSYKISIAKDELLSFKKGNVNLCFEIVADQEELYYSNNIGYVYIECSHSSTKTILTKATTSKEGKKVVVCNDCGETVSTTTIAKISGMSLSKTTYIYDGQAKKPTITVKDSSGKIISSSNYTIGYSNNVNVGKATVNVIFVGNYSGSLTKTFTINPKGTTTIGKLKAKKKKIIVKWTKVSKQITGYEVQYSTSKKFMKKTRKTKTVKASKKKLTIKKLKSKKKYYVRIRTYKIVGGTKYYSTWSKSKSVKTK